MIKINTLIFLITISVLAFAHFFFLEFYLYWRYPWIDVTTHTLGGVAVSLGTYALKDFWYSLPLWLLKFWSVLIIVALVALAWEIFEVWSGVSINEPNYWLDTSSDLFFGLLGGVIGFLVAKRIRQL